MAIIKASEVTRRTGMPRSSIYEHAAQGTFTKPVKIGAHASGWPDYEVDAITSARIAGWSNDQVRSLVRALHAQRKTAADGLLITPLVGENAFTKPNKGFPKEVPDHADRVDRTEAGRGERRAGGGSFRDSAAERRADAVPQAGASDRGSMTCPTHTAARRGPCGGDWLGYDEKQRQG